jgi:hypothetical protein
MAGKHFCVSFAHPRDSEVCMEIGQSVLWDNGAFSLYTKGKTIDERALHRWLEPRLFHPHRAIVLDEIGGDTHTQRQFLQRWPFDKELSWPVWHLDKPLDYLNELADNWPGLAFGSAGAYWKLGAPEWRRRMDEAFEVLSKRRFMPWVHGLRMLAQSGKQWPLASADSVNIARNYAGTPSRGVEPQCPRAMAERIDAVQCPGAFIKRAPETRTKPKKENSPC